MLTYTHFLLHGPVIVSVSNEEEEHNEGRLSGAGGPIMFAVIVKMRVNLFSTYIHTFFAS